MSYANVTDYISSKNTLTTQLLSTDDTVANITTTMTALSTKKATILSNLAASTVLDSASANTSAEKLTWIRTVSSCQGVDTEIIDILCYGWKRCLDILIPAAAPGSAVTDLYTRLSDIKALILAYIPASRISVYTFLTQAF